MNQIFQEAIRKCDAELAAGRISREAAVSIKAELYKKSAELSDPLNPGNHVMSREESVEFIKNVFRKGESNG